MCVIYLKLGGVAVLDDALLRGCLKNSESLQNLDVVLAHLTIKQRTELVKLIKSYLSLFGDTSSRTSLVA